MNRGKVHLVHGAGFNWSKSGKVAGIEFRIPCYIYILFFSHMLSFGTHQNLWPGINAYAYSQEPTDIQIIPGNNFKTVHWMAERFNRKITGAAASGLFDF